MSKEEIKELLIKQCYEFNCDDNRLNKAVSTYGSIDIDELSKVIEEFKKVPTLDELIKENNKLKCKIDQQDQIIREAREYVNLRLKECEEYNCCGMQPEYKEELIEILDRNVK